MNADFSRTLALLRQEKGISQRKAAKELGISQALLSHYENGIREPGLAFVKKACNYYHVSADYLLGRTLDRDGGMIDAESLYDSSDEKGTLRGSIAATLQKKMLVNTAGVLFELLGKTNDRTLITSAGSYLGGAFYQLYRALHRASGGKEGYFGLDATAYQSGAVDAQMRADYIAYASSLAALAEKDGAFAPMEDEALTALYGNTWLGNAAAAGAAAMSGGALTAFELLCDNALMDYIRAAKLRSFGAAHVSAYLAAMENETTAARMILTGRLAGLQPAVIRERLRETYA